MIRVYFLPLVMVDEIEQVAGIQFIHDALLECTQEPNIRKLIMDCTLEERDIFHPLAIEARDPTQAEIDRYTAQVIILPPDPDTLRAQELLGSSPPVITMVEMWELMRIYGRRIGYDF